MELLAWLVAGILDPIIKRLDKHRERRFREAELEHDDEREDEDAPGTRGGPDMDS